MSEAAVVECEQCGAPVPVDEGFVPWCDGCGWNAVDELLAEAVRRESAARLARAERWDREVFEQVMGQGRLRRRVDRRTIEAYGVATIVHLLTLALLLGGLWLAIATWFNLLALFGGVLMLWYAYDMRPRLGRVPRDARTVDPTEQPLLHGLVAEVAAAMDAAPPARIHIDARFNAAAARVGLRGRSVLTIGYPLWNILEPGERVAVLAHELGHLVNGDPRRGVYLSSALHAVEQWREIFQPMSVVRDDAYTPVVSMRAGELLVRLLQLPFALVARGLSRLLSDLTDRDSRRAEYLADELAARIAGVEVTASMLGKLALGRSAMISLERARGSTESMWDVERSFIDSVPPREYLRLRRASDVAILSSTHPTRERRIAFVESRSVEGPLVHLSSHSNATIDRELAPLARDVEQTLRASSSTFVR